MKKNVMALSIAAMIGGLGFAGMASAAVIAGSGGATPTAADIQGDLMAAAAAANLTVAPGGTGNALVVPYFNAQNGNMTVLHVTNTDQKNGKVVKVRFRGASNSDDILDFQLFLSPGDVWTAAILADADGLANLVTADNTCTVPAIAKNTLVPFDKTRLPTFGMYADEAARNNLTREGYVEIFNMADITDVKTWDSDGNVSATGSKNSPLYLATKHVSKVAPCSVAGSSARAFLDSLAITEHTEITAVRSGMQTPTGGLSGDWYIMNVPQTTTFSGAATAIVADGRANFTHSPQLGNNAAPTDGVGNPLTVNDVTADPLFRSANVFNAAGAAVAAPTLPLLSYDVPDMSTPMLAGGDALVQATDLLEQLAVTSVTNQYANDASVSGKTDWVFSMPARRYNVAANYAAVTGTTGATGPTSANSNFRLFTDLPGLNQQTGNWFYPADGADNAPGAGNGAGPTIPKAAGNTSVQAGGNGNICVAADGQRFFDREETTGTSVPVFSPGTATTLEFCGEVSVAKFNAETDATSVLGASVATRGITKGAYTSGWAVVNTGNSEMGLPLIGSAFIKLTNPEAAPNTVGTYGITWPHRFTK